VQTGNVSFKRFQNQTIRV